MRLSHVFRSASIFLAAQAAGAGQASFADPGPVPPTAIGINLSGIGPHNLANLAIGNDWILIASRWLPFPAANETADGGVASLPPGSSAALVLKLPDTGPEGTTIRCTWVGRGRVGLQGARTSNVLANSNSLSFHIVDPPNVNSGAWLRVGAVDPGSSIHQIDCRETTVPANAVFYPAFLNSLKGFKTIRFMDWQRTNENVTVTWTTRNQPSSIGFGKADGVPVEIELALANEVGANPWFCMPWNADASYVEHFAQYVHDHLPAGHRVYVETGNEIWNIGFPAAKQAMAEGLSEGLSTDRGTATLYRYAERTKQVMDIWARVFADHPQRLVRIAATQQWVPLRADVVLGFRDTAAHVDALATSAYIGGDLMKGGVTDNLDELFRRINAGLDGTMAQLLANKAIAHKYGKTYAAYEAGQGITIPYNIPLLQKIERDPRMYDLYRQFIGDWRKQVGGPLTLFNSVGSIRTSGAYGLLEYAGQPLAEAPKMRAVADELAK